MTPYVADIPHANYGVSAGSGGVESASERGKPVSEREGSAVFQPSGARFTPPEYASDLRHRLRNDSGNERGMSGRCVLFRRLVLQVGDCELRVRSSAGATLPAYSWHPTRSLAGISCRQVEDWDRGEPVSKQMSVVGYRRAQTFCAHRTSCTS